MQNPSDVNLCLYIDTHWTERLALFIAPVPPMLRLRSHFRPPAGKINGSEHRGGTSSAEEQLLWRCGLTVVTETGFKQNYMKKSLKVKIIYFIGKCCGLMYSSMSQPLSLCFSSVVSSDGLQILHILLCWTVSHCQTCDSSYLMFWEFSDVTQTQHVSSHVNHHQHWCLSRDY